jgi:hypothetical protein
VCTDVKIGMFFPLPSTLLSTVEVTWVV